MSWKVSLSGKINMKLEATRNVEMPYLPRFGLRLFLDERMDQVEYFGYGPYEKLLRQTSEQLSRSVPNRRGNYA